MWVDSYRVYAADGDNLSEACLVGGFAEAAYAGRTAMFVLELISRHEIEESTVFISPVGGGLHLAEGMHLVVRRDGGFEYPDAPDRDALAGQLDARGEVLDWGSQSLISCTREDFDAYLGTLSEWFNARRYSTAKQARGPYAPN